jgi:hypothetical protein
MSTNIYFAVQATWNSLSWHIMFDRVLVNVGGAWDPAASVFTAPYAGNYFISVTIGATYSSYYGSYFVAVQVGGNTQAIATFNTGSANYISSTRVSAMLKLLASDTVAFVPTNTGSYTTEDGLTSAQGFYYSPLGGTTAAVAWGLGLVLDWNMAVGPEPVVAFNMVNVNLQGVWSNTTNKVTIPAAGTYFIDLTFTFCGSDKGSYGNGNSG